MKRLNAAVVFFVFTSLGWSNAIVSSSWHLPCESGSTTLTDPLDPLQLAIDCEGPSLKASAYAQVNPTGGFVEEHVHFSAMQVDVAATATNQMSAEVPSAGDYELLFSLKGRALRDSFGGMWFTVNGAGLNNTWLVDPGRWLPIVDVVFATDMITLQAGSYNFTCTTNAQVVGYDGWGVADLFLSSNFIGLQAVPEPTTLLLVGSALLLLGIHRSFNLLQLARRALGSLHSN